MKTIITSYLSFLLLFLFLCSCNDLEIISPPGPMGLSAYKDWVERVETGEIKWGEETDFANFMKYLTGKDGANGTSAYEEWKTYISTGEVDNPNKPGEKWDKTKNSQSSFFKFLTGAKGDSGNIPVISIGHNGNWYIDGKDTGKPSKGEPGDTGKPSKGEPGNTPVVTIGSNGNWFVDGKDTGKPSKGDNGDSGKTAYEIWVEEVNDGNIKKDGVFWPQDETSLSDFWRYLSGSDGQGQGGYNETPWIEIVNEGPFDDNFWTIEVKTYHAYIVIVNSGKNSQEHLDVYTPFTIKYPRDKFHDISVILIAKSSTGIVSYPVIVDVRKAYLEKSFSLIVDQAKYTDSKGIPGSPYSKEENLFRIPPAGFGTVVVPYKGVNVANIEYSISETYADYSVVVHKENQTIELIGPTSSFGKGKLTGTITYTDGTVSTDGPYYLDGLAPTMPGYD